MRIAVIPGSFDPITVGHEDLIRRSFRMCDRLIVGVGRNSSKKPLFSVEERIAMIQTIVAPYGEGDPPTVLGFDGLLVEFCKQNHATLIIRGLRAVMDFEYELGIAHANADQEPGIETVFLAAQPEHSFVSSSVVRELASHGGYVSSYVRPVVEAALVQKFATKN